jgi:hypothetical protein
MISVTRMATIAAFLAIAVIELFAVFDRQQTGFPNVGLSSDGPRSNNRFVVTSVPAKSALHVGDRVAIDDPRTLAAFQYRSLGAGSSITVRRFEPRPATTVEVPIVRAPPVPQRWMIFVVQLLFIAIAVLMVARGRAGGSLSLAWPFVLMTTLVNPTSPAWPTWMILTFEVIGPSILGVAFLCASDFATRFAGDPNAEWARRIRFAAWVFGAITVLVNTTVALLGIVATDSPAWQAVLSLAAILCQVLLFLVALVFAYVKAPSAERQRVSWVAASLGVGVVGFVTTIVMSFAGIPEPLRDYPLFLTLAMPFGCAYAILRYRLLDIAFVVNRATVFGITSLLVIAALALVDWALQTLLGSWLVHTGLYVQLALALAIGIATRPLHDRVDAFVDDVFFRRRHEAERTLRQFARDVSYIDDSKVVLERTVETVASAAQLRCAVFLMTGDGLATAAASADSGARALLDRNDAAVVRLLATREPVDLHQVDTSLAGDFAFPMFARSRLIGIVVCGGKTDGPTAYAPDELEAIGNVAHASGLALDLLRIERLERELEAYRTGVAPLRT